MRRIFGCPGISRSRGRDSPAKCAMQASIRESQDATGAFEINAFVAGAV